MGIIKQFVQLQQVFNRSETLLLFRVYLFRVQYIPVQDCLETGPNKTNYRPDCITDYSCNENVLNMKHIITAIDKMGTVHYQLPEYLQRLIHTVHVRCTGPACVLSVDKRSPFLNYRSHNRILIMKDLFQQSSCIILYDSIVIYKLYCVVMIVNVLKP